jgi:hypothetical protein
VEIQKILRDVQGITFVYFSDQDVVRHHLVSSIIRAYDAYEARRASPPPPTPGAALMPAAIVDRQRRVAVPTSRLARAAQRALDALGRPDGEVDVAIVDDAEIRELNATHRGIRRRTDVLAFPLELPGRRAVSSARS